MRFSRSQFEAIEELEAKRALEDGLYAFERDLVAEDPVLHQQVTAYRMSGDWRIWHRIVTLTDKGVYQRGLFALCLQSGIDITTDQNFAYIMENPALSGNTKARHVILMAMAFHRRSETTE
ncbi:hypothetical protein So717_41390 [Roseobacter cerasinus]|uniref:Uncharacterized protein n=1 Tax=Roseobacter cerasinus TaxID=2602289 RepID=A0A640W1M2_9RHOB|nr:hypothetical protein [Roseobacter cerasinus]GFE52386.1 hypothetical protein So717_41390 [Roseobacter cerasinus]